MPQLPKLTLRYAVLCFTLICSIVIVALFVLVERL